MQMGASRNEWALLSLRHPSAAGTERLCHSLHLQNAVTAAMLMHDPATKGRLHCMPLMSEQAATPLAPPDSHFWHRVMVNLQTLLGSMQSEADPTQPQGLRAADHSRCSRPAWQTLMCTPDDAKAPFRPERRFGVLPPAQMKLYLTPQQRQSCLRLRNAHVQKVRDIMQDRFRINTMMQTTLPAHEFELQAVRQHIRCACKF